MSNLWYLKKEKFSIELNYLSSIPTISHPLSNNGNLKNVRNIQVKKQQKSEFIDPLSIALDGSDPLTIGFSGKGALPPNAKEVSQEENNCKSWQEICSLHLSKCVTKQKLSLSSHFPLKSELGAPNFETLGYNKVKGSTQTESERIQMRLEYLNTMEDSKVSKDLTSLTTDQFSEYISFLKSDMLNVWKSEHRVKALKIAKECAKSLCLSTPEIFYPNKFMLVTDLLSTLGNLVHQRLSEIPQVQYSSSDSMEAKEIARNWFSNISSIRDLLPRIYLEAALLQCYAFSDIDTIGDAFERLLKMTRGLGDPLVSAYAKMYIAKVGLRGSHMMHITTAICDINDVFRKGWSEQGIESIESNNEDSLHGKELAEKIFYPPLLWLLQCLVNCSSLDKYKLIFETCSKSDELAQFLLLKAILATYPASFVVSECLAFSGLISSSLMNGVNPQDLLICYGKIINSAPPIKERKYELMSDIWELLCSLEDLNIFIKSCDPWIQFAVQNFEVNDNAKILSNLVKKIKSLCEDQSKSYHFDLLQMVVNILRSAIHPELLLQRPNIQQLLTMLQRELVVSGAIGKQCKTRLGLSELKELVEVVISHHPSPLREPSLIKILIELFSSLHSRFNALTTSDEKRQIACLLHDFILKVDFGKDFTQQLEFYVSCRASFVSLDSILEILIHQVCRLQMETLLIVKRKHTSKTASFERACTAYCYITIPSMTSSHKRLQLYLLAGSVAMVNSCVSQAQTCIESGIKEISKCTELLSSKCGFFLSTVLCLCSFLIATPCLSESSLYWFVSVMKAVRSMAGNTEFTAKIDVAIFKAVCAASQKQLPYHFNKVVGNDSIFSLERRRLEVVELCYQQLSTFLSSVIESNSESNYSMKTELLDCLLQYGDCELNALKVTSIFKGIKKEKDKMYYGKKIRSLMQ